MCLYEDDETVYVPVTHGNSKKDNASEYTRTDPSVLKTIEDQVKKNAMEIYRENIADHFIPGIQEGVLNARNVKLVEHIVRKVNEQKRISKNGIYNPVLLAYHMEGYIHEVFPDLTTVIALPEMISLVNQLRDVTTEDVVPFIFFL